MRESVISSFMPSEQNGVPANHNEMLPTIFGEITVLATNQYSETLYVPVYIDDECAGLTGNTYLVTPGNHTIGVLSPITDYMTYNHEFQYFYYDGNYNESNPIMLLMLPINEDKIITAYYYSIYN